MISVHAAAASIRFLPQKREISPGACGSRIGTAVAIRGAMLHRDLCLADLDSVFGGTDEYTYDSPDAYYQPDTSYQPDTTPPVTPPPVTTEPEIPNPGEAYRAAEPETPATEPGTPM